jgi:rubrerythrin
VDKYGVETDQTKEKTASDKGACPSCGTTLSKEAPNHCPKCGTKPFEKVK